jgi:hypothetical protein
VQHSSLFWAHGAGKKRVAHVLPEPPSLKALCGVIVAWGPKQASPYHRRCPVCERESRRPAPPSPVVPPPGRRALIAERVEAAAPPAGFRHGVPIEDWRAIHLTGDEWWLLTPTPRQAVYLDLWVWHCWRTKSQRSRRTEHEMPGVRKLR